jgi:hypothetical protein
MRAGTDASLAACRRSELTGLELILHSNRPGPPSCAPDSPNPCGGQDLWVSTRSSVTDLVACPVNLGAVLNSSSNDLQAAFSDDAEVLFFSSNRLTDDAFGSDHFWMTTREPQQARSLGDPDLVFDLLCYLRPGQALVAKPKDLLLGSRMSGSTASTHAEAGTTKLMAHCRRRDA